MSFEGQSTSTRSLFYRQYTNILAEIAEEIAPTVVGTGATLGACKHIFSYLIGKLQRKLPCIFFCILTFFKFPTLRSSNANNALVWRIESTGNWSAATFFTNPSASRWLPPKPDLQHSGTCLVGQLRLYTFHNTPNWMISSQCVGRRGCVILSLRTPWESSVWPAWKQSTVQLSWLSTAGLSVGGLAALLFWENPSRRCLRIGWASFLLLIWKEAAPKQWLDTSLRRWRRNIARCLQLVPLSEGENEVSEDWQGKEGLKYWAEHFSVSSETYIAKETNGVGGVQLWRQEPGSLLSVFCFRRHWGFWDLRPMNW